MKYSKSSRATCKGPLPCKGTPILAGNLRYGQVVSGEYGDMVEWRHWGCVTPIILGALSAQNPRNIKGYDSLKSEDQQKVRRAISNRCIDATDIPPSVRTLVAPPVARSNVTAGSSQRKRKASFDPGVSFASPSQSNSSQVPHVGRYNHHMPISEDSDDEVILIEDPRDELYCVMQASVVGVQYYKGLVGPGEEVRLIREPHNRYDRNAIQVMNIGGTQVGHIPRNIASKLSPLLDRGSVTVEGVMREGNLTRSSYSLSMTLKIYGASDRRDQLEPQLIWATPHQRGFPPRGSGAVPGAPVSSGRASASASSSSVSRPSTQQASQRGLSAAQARAQQEASRRQQEAIQKQQEALQKASELKDMLNTLEKVDDEGRRTSLLDTLCSKDDILNLPIHPSPPGIQSGDLVVDLLKHQSQALQWCIEHEYPKLPKQESDKPVQFWQYMKSGSKSYYYNIATKTPQELTSPPQLERGALVGDSMGLGKTLTILALILATKDDLPPNHSKCTLIVVPLSVMSNWEKQIEEHCVRGALRYCVYYGSARNMSPEELMQYDVVITTYQTVTSEDPDAIAVSNGPEGHPKKRKKSKNEKGLFDVKWKRVVLDEGHNIRNPKTKMAKAVCKLTAQRRWVLSGTPIINSPRDLGSILTFLQICRPLDNEDFYKRLLLRPLKDGDPVGAELLRALMSHICIRRTKEMQDSEGNYLVPLPPVEMTLVPVTLNDEARALYDAVEQVSQQKVENIMNQNGGMNTVVTTNVLSMLTRLRQLALHPGLVPSDYLEQLRANEDAPHAAIEITPAEKLRLQALLAQLIEDSEECPICFSILTEPRITSCAHSFCFACIQEVIARDPKCPMDRRLIGMGDLIEPPPPTELTQVLVRQEENEDNNALRSGSSAKIDQLVHLLQLTPANEKSLVFSQFTSFLDKHGISYVRFDGQMSAKRRQETLERFCVPLEDAPASTETPLPPSLRTRRSARAIYTDDSLINDEKDASFVADGADHDFDGDFLAPTRSQKVKGKGKSRAKTSAKPTFKDSFFTGENPKVMLISLKAGALGLNLTVANNVYLWWQEGIESQAIDRCNRIGQKKPVHVYQLIAENTVESKVIDIQERKNY
ncbi:hypothetical protein SERLA73DRAFT_167889 [Serpula lacrymans var. lacrymans S7.3]|uniref:Uncharacterized protein n=1 Tax=Serpula lacrymans var. lacrymans (strain S7.3) TaxID=936435 RepID=F8PUK4_SERL3|nr:hypothetical protein SERLA73DRAFT_167889 [Serpula lacrymans var. lacrymans S7.3]